MFVDTFLLNGRLKYMMLRSVVFALFWLLVSVMQVFRVAVAFKCFYIEGGSLNKDFFIMRDGGDTSAD